MPYFKNNSVTILFIHIPKTGGSSIELYFAHKFKFSLNVDSLYGFISEKEKLKNNILINSSLQHITYQTILKYKKYFNILDINNIKIMTIVRNPYERIISDLFFLLKINIDTSKSEVFIIIKQYLSEHLDNHNIPQSSFVINHNNELIPNIFILHTETLTTDMINLGYTDFNFHDNKNKLKINYYDYLNNDSINLINNFYNYDFILFNYTKINPFKC